MSKIIVIGAGAMGLVTAYDLLKNGHSVTVLESENYIGGMSSHFDFDGLNIERFYHFICGPDEFYFNIMKELGIYKKLKWTETKMAYFYQGNIYKWGNPVHLLTFPKLDIISKIRYGLHAYWTTKTNDWSKLDKIYAVEWIKKWIGTQAYNILWKKLFELKFFKYTNNLSAAWIGTRIKRVGLSRKNVFKERMGYLEGGSKTFFDAIADKIIKLGGKIKLNNKVTKAKIRNKAIKGVYVDKKFFKADAIISTIPLPYVAGIFKDLPKEIKNKYSSKINIPVICVIMKINKSLTDNFWLNINDERIDIPGIIEYSNLNPLKEKIIYAPFYMQKKHPDFLKDDNYFVNKVKEYLKIINPNFSIENIILSKVFRYEYAQPVCPPEYLQGIPEINPGIKGLFIADTSFYYPEDRSISESIRVGRNIAKMIGNEE